MTALGPTVGGFLIVWGGWPAIFIVNLPFIILSFLLGLYMFPKDQKKGAGIKTIIQQLDILGIVLFAGGIIFLLSFCCRSARRRMRLKVISSLLLLCAFVWRELKTDKPFIDVRLFKTQRNLSAVYVQFILLNVFFYCLFLVCQVTFRMKCIFLFKRAACLCCLCLE